MGQFVKRGQIIGELGLSGWTTGCHLHFSVLKDGSYVDPQQVLYSGANEVANRMESYFQKNISTIWYYGDERDTYRIWNNCGVMYREVKNGTFKPDGSGIGYTGSLFYNNRLNQTFLVKNGIWEEYQTVGGPCGLLGSPTYSSGMGKL